MRIAYSPCPNDTFVFHAWSHGLVPGAPALDVTFADIDITNGLAERAAAAASRAAATPDSGGTGAGKGPDTGAGAETGTGTDTGKGTAAGPGSAPLSPGSGPVSDSDPRLGPLLDLDVLKVSYAVLPWILDTYALLPCGGALGRGCGPLVLTAAPGRAAGLRGKRVAVPSERSTAYLLFRLWAAAEVPGGVGEIVVLPFHEIMPAVRDGAVDAGLVIHEARFTYRDYGLHCLADMGEHWENTTGLPIPLGAIVAKRSLGERRLRELADAVRASVRMAWDDPEASRPYVLEHAQEMDPAVADQHIGLYVNEFTADLGEAGYAAVRGLLTRAAAEGLVPPIAPDALAFPPSAG
ncbi:1,4-dihydroxy-6-naphthoate synthase [Streptomyces albus]|uniref:1,4-dihydroxy-6-naphthoate synthase n=1 Tax=Streptomyces albus TaxID=1888 RepID=UPI001FCA1731|nr:1,4-dihydroxy-6-naphthoate synthase [Streptomyces albus]